MKKYVIPLRIMTLAVSLLSTLIYIVGEVFTATTYGYCLVAQSALRQMYDQSDEFVFLIPLIWQYDGPYPRPGIGTRIPLYGVSGIPHGQWEAIAAANSYHIYSSNDPYIEEWDEIAIVQEPEFSESIIEERKFYIVIASTEEVPVLRSNYSVDTITRE